MFSIEESLRSARLHSLFSDKKAHPFDELSLSTSPRRGQSVSPRRQGASSSPVSVMSAPSPLPLLTPKRRRMVDDELTRLDESESGPSKRHQPSSLRAEFTSPALDFPSDSDDDMDPLSDDSSADAHHLKGGPAPALALRPSAARVRARATALSAADLEAVESLMGIKHASPAPAPPSPPQLAARVWPRGDPVPAVAVAVAVPAAARPVPVQARAVEPSAFCMLPPPAVPALPVVTAAPLRATLITRAEAVSIAAEPARPVPLPSAAACRPVPALPVSPAQPVALPLPLPVPAVAVAAAAVPALPLSSAASAASTLSPATVVASSPVPALAVPSAAVGAVVRAKPLPLPVVSARVVTASGPVPSRVISVAAEALPVPAQVLRCEDRVPARVVGRVVTPAELLQVHSSPVKAPSPVPAIAL